jgi:hypothetical protein
MSDWLKILISTLSGFVAGTIAQPLNLVIADWVKRRHLRRALYIELTANIGVLAAYAFKPGSDSDYFRAVELFGPLLRHEAYDYALRQPDVFLRLRDAPIIRLLYERMAQIQEGSDVDVNDVSAHVTTLIQAGELNARLLKKLAPEHARDDIIALESRRAEYMRRRKALDE